MMRKTMMVCLILAACASTVAERDRAAITKLILEENEQSRRAWQARDASLMFPEGGDAVVAPDGRRISSADQRADLQRRMNMTMSIEEMSVQIVRIDLQGDEAVAISRQRFVRTMRVEGKERQRISGVSHRQRFRREGGRWKAYGPLEEFDQEARWAE